MCVCVCGCSTPIVSAPASVEAGRAGSSRSVSPLGGRGRRHLAPGGLLWAMPRKCTVGCEATHTHRIPHTHTHASRHTRVSHTLSHTHTHPTNTLTALTPACLPLSLFQLVPLLCVCLSRVCPPFPPDDVAGMVGAGTSDPNTATARESRLVQSMREEGRWAGPGRRARMFDGSHGGLWESPPRHTHTYTQAPTPPRAETPASVTVKEAPASVVTEGRGGEGGWKVLRMTVPPPPPPPVRG